MMPPGYPAASPPGSSHWPQLQFSRSFKAFLSSPPHLLGKVNEGKLGSGQRQLSELSLRTFPAPSALNHSGERNGTKMIISYLLMT